MCGPVSVWCIALQKKNRLSDIQHKPVRIELDLIHTKNTANLEEYQYYLLTVAH